MVWIRMTRLKASKGQTEAALGLLGYPVSERTAQGVIGLGAQQVLNSAEESPVRRGGTKWAI